MDRLEQFKKYIEAEKEQEILSYQETQKQRHAYHAELLNSVLLKINKFEDSQR